MNCVLSQSHAVTLLDDSKDSLRKYFNAVIMQNVDFEFGYRLIGLHIQRKSSILDNANEHTSLLRTTSNTQQVSEILGYELF